jgi:hypothetical protein
LILPKETWLPKNLGKLEIVIQYLVGFLVGGSCELGLKGSKTIDNVGERA